MDTIKIKPSIEVIDNANGSKIYSGFITRDFLMKNTFDLPLINDFKGNLTIIIGGVNWDEFKLIPVIEYKGGEMLEPTTSVGTTYIYAGIPKGNICLHIHSRQESTLYS